MSIKSVKDYRAVKSPKPNQNKPHHTQNHACGLAIQKLLDKPQQTRVHHVAAPFDEEKDNNKKSNQPCNQPEQHHPIKGSDSTDQHTPQKMRKQSHKPTKQKIIGTLSSSHTTHAHPTRNETNRIPLKRLCQTLHTPTQQTKSAAQVKTFQDPPALVFLPPSHQNHCPAGRCRSR